MEQTQREVIQHKKSIYSLNFKETNYLKKIVSNKNQDYLRRKKKKTLLDNTSKEKITKLLESEPNSRK